MHYVIPKFGQRDQKRKFVFAENKTLLMIAFGLLYFILLVAEH
jgi:hypothetical protein